MFFGPPDYLGFDDALYAAARLLSIVAMSASLHSVVTAVLAAWLLRERLSAVQRTGIVLATVGVVAMASGH